MPTDADTERAIEVYDHAISLAKHELDIILPNFNKLSERVRLLRMFVTTGTKILERKLYDEDEKYINTWETETYRTVQSNLGNRTKRK